MLVTFENLILLAAVFFIGACMGSFFKLTVDRYGTSDSVVFKPSYCFHCKKKLLWWHNMPVVSYLILGGKCFFCREKIDINCFYSELASGLLILSVFLSGVIKKQSNFDIGLTLLFISFLIVLSIFDLKHRIIPHVITYSAIILFLIADFFPGKSVLSFFVNLGVAYIFMDLLYFFAVMIKKFEPEINLISIPLIIWITIFFYFHNIYIVLIPCLIYFIIIKFNVSLKSYKILWIVLFIILLFQIYKTGFLDFNLYNLGLLFAGFGIVYFICEILLYFFGLFVDPPDENQNVSDSMNISIGGGDITVFALISVFLGFKLAFVVLFLASLLAIISHFIIRAISFFKKITVSQAVPFVPYLSFACFIIIITSHGG